MGRINVNWDVNVSCGSESVTLEDLDCKTIEEWNKLNKSDQKERLQEVLNELPERTCIIVDNWY